jgi:uncharacterized membrane protein YcaP (DUF421 family)
LTHLRRAGVNNVEDVAEAYMEGDGFITAIANVPTNT